MATPADLAAARRRVRQLREFIELMPNGLVQLDIATFRVTLANDYARQCLGYSEEDMAGGITATDLIRPDYLAVIMTMHSALAGESLANKTPYQRAERQNSYEVVLIRKDGSSFPVQIEGSYVLDANGIPTGARYLFRDITERKRLEEERAQLLGDLQKTAADIRTLQGLLPICAICKSVRDDRGYWTQIESYMRKHTDVDFSHGLCPACRAEVANEPA